MCQRAPGEVTSVLMCHQGWRGKATRFASWPIFSPHPLPCVIASYPPMAQRLYRGGGVSGVFWANPRSLTWHLTASIVVRTLPACSPVPTSSPEPSILTPEGSLQLHAFGPPHLEPGTASGLLQFRAQAGPNCSLRWLSQSSWGRGWSLQGPL